MNTFVIEAHAKAVHCTENEVVVALTDGRSISAPLVWYPRLYHGTLEERNDYALNADGSGIHWPALDEDLTVRGILLGQPSQESAASLNRWLSERTAPRSE